MNNKSVIVFSSDIRGINYKIPERAKDLDKTTVKKITNAINYGKTDSRGLIWINCSTIVERRREENPKNRYLSLVMEILNEINESDDIQLLRLRPKNLIEKRVKQVGDRCEKFC